MAQRILQKRSSIQGRRPTASYLEPGELAINTNGSDPGLFFEGNDGSIIKAGPTAMGDTAPTSEIPYGHGEAWYNTQSKQLNLYNASFGEWQTALSPMYGGSDYLVFVGSNFPEANDSIGNDGSAAPFATFNRAVLEIAKRSILQGRSDSPTQSKFAIVLLPGENIARTEPGTTLNEFLDEYTAFTANQELTPEILKVFNPPEGGVVLPRGTSVVGITPFKGEIVPTYVPEWTRAAYEDEDVELASATGIFHATGGSLIERVTFTDKRSSLEIVSIGGEYEGVAELTTLAPHGLQVMTLNDDGDEVIAGDLITLTYPDTVSRTNQGQESIPEGTYWAEALSETTLRLRRVADLSVVLRKELPGAPTPGSNPSDYCTLTVGLKTHHRLAAVKFASQSILEEYYSKIQYAYSSILFGGAVDNAEVIPSEVNIGLTLTDSPTPAVDNTYDRPVTVAHCSLNSNYGLCGLNADGDLVGGLKQMNSFGMNYRAFNNDPDVYEVYYDQTWISLKEATWRGSGIIESEVTDELALQYLIDQVNIEDLRYYIRPLTFDTTVASDVGAGIIDPESDTRHYSVCASNNAFAQTSEQKSTGAAVAFWSKSGGRILVEGAGCFLGEDSFRADGFKGIGSISGANENQKNFEIVGIRRPSIISARELSDASNRHLIYLNSAIQTTTATTIVFAQSINTHSLLPYTLREGSVIWVSDLTDGNTFSATIASGGLSADGLTLSVESTDNAINGADLTTLSVPYIRRFLDPRDQTQRNYYLHVRNTSESHTPPVTGSVLRFAENQGSSVNPLLVNGRQLDPGENGGWNHLFVVHQAMSFEEGNNPNELNPWNHIPEKSDSYYISLSLADSFGPHLETKTYAKGSYVTSNERAYVADYSEVEDTEYVLPSEERSVWSLARRGDYLQPVESAFVSSNYSSVVDSNLSSYPDGSLYARGMQPSDGRYDDLVVLDYDDGSADFGLADPTNPAFANTTLIDPDYANSRQAIFRFLEILGYNTAEIDTLLEPQFWINRDISTGLFPPLTGNGYALSAGNWPVEFCSPSHIQAIGVTWRSPGMHNISKGFPGYEATPPGKEMRFDAMRSSTFGGRIDVTGGNNFGEVLPVMIDTSRRTEDIF